MFLYILEFNISKFNISYSKQGQNYPSDLKKAADTESSRGIISSAQIPDVGNAYTIFVF